MSIITKPTIAKGQANEIDLSKSELAAVSKVVNDSYFSDQTNWSKVIVEYKSAEGNQHEMVIFDASQASPKGNFEVSEKARDSWEVQSVKIVDFDGGYLKLVRGDLTVADFDIALGSVGGENYITWDVLSSGVTAEADGGIYGGSANINTLSKSSTVYTGDLHITAYIDTTQSTNRIFFGFTENVLVDSFGPNFTGIEIDASDISGRYFAYVNASSNSGYYTPSANTKVEVIRSGTSLVLKIDDIVLVNTTVSVFSAYACVRTYGSALGTIYQATSVVSENYITWSLNAFSANLNSTGGVSGGSSSVSASVKSNAIMVGNDDFSLTFKFNKSDLLDRMIWGFVEDENQIGSESLDYLGLYGFSSQNSNSQLGSFVNATSFQGHLNISSLPNGENVLVIERVGGTLNFKINGSIVRSVSYGGSTIVPVVRTMGGISCFESAINF